MGKYKTYGKYKPSDLEWIGEVPERWLFLSLKWVVEKRITDGPHETPELLDDGVIFISAEAVENGKINFNRARGFISREQHNIYAKKCLPKRDDIFIVKSGSTTGKVAYVDTDIEFNIWSPLALIRTKNEICNSRFLFYALTSDFFQKQVQLSWSFGTQPNIGMGVIENLKVSLPPIEEQKQIARFLDRETTRIDTLITKKRQLIALLQKKQDAIIHQAITEGIDLTVSLENSGISWIGEIPKHWHTIRLKFLVERIEQGWSPQCENRLAEENEWGVLKVGCVNYGYFNELEHKALPIDLQPKLEYRINVGDILVSRANTKELVGSTARVFALSRRLLLCDKLYRLSIYESINPDYLVLVLNSKIIRFQFERDSSGASDSMQNIAQSSMMNFLIPLPPISDQKSILELLQKKLHRLEEAKEKIAEQLKDLDKYRMSLITAAVTGKIDVREEVN